MRYRSDVVEGSGELTSKQIAKFSRKVFVNEKAKFYFTQCAMGGSTTRQHNWAMFVHSIPLKRRLIVAGWVLGNAEAVETFDVMSIGDRKAVRDAIVKGLAYHQGFLLDQTDPIEVKIYKDARKAQYNAWKSAHASVIAGFVGSGMKV